MQSYKCAFIDPDFPTGLIDYSEFEQLSNSTLLYGLGKSTTLKSISFADDLQNMTAFYNDALNYYNNSRDIQHHAVDLDFVMFETDPDNTLMALMTSNVKLKFMLNDAILADLKTHLHTAKGLADAEQMPMMSYYRIQQIIQSKRLNDGQVNTLRNAAEQNIATADTIREVMKEVTETLIAPFNSGWC